MSHFRVTFKKGNGIDAEDLANQVRALTRRYATRVQEMYTDDATGTWNEAPDFPDTELIENGNLVINVGPDGEERVVKKFRYVDEGTSVRYARMTRDFVPKSSSGRLRSGPGRGGFAELDGIFRPGIAARNFGDQIVDELRDQFLTDMREIFNGLS
jgi:hypothetical protein